MVFFKKLCSFLRCLLNSISRHNTITLAGVIAFFGFSAMMPLIILVIYATSIFIPPNTIQDFLLEVFQSYVPTIPDTKIYLSQNIVRFVQMSPKVGLIGLVGLIWTSVGGFVSFQQILDIIWEKHHRRSFFMRYLVGFGMLGILLSLTLLSSLGSILLPVLIKTIFHNVKMVSWLNLVHDISRISFPSFLFITCYMCYRFLPSYVIPNRFLLIGAFLSTVLTYLWREVFIWYTGHLEYYEMLYGSLTFMILFTFWGYIVSVILLFGAEVAITLTGNTQSNKSKSFKEGSES